MPTIAEPKPQQSIDPRLTVPFVDSVRNVMTTMAKLSTTIQPARIRDDHRADYDYAGVVTFTGAIVGTVVVGFHRHAAVEIVTAFAGCPITPDSPDFADALGELANMIAGAAKRAFGTNASISTPSVLMGHERVIDRPHDVPCVVIPCAAGGAAFAIELSLRTA